MGRRELNSARTVKDAGGWVGRQWNFMKFRTKTPSLKLREMSHQVKILCFPPIQNVEETWRDNGGGFEEVASTLQSAIMLD